MVAATTISGPWSNGLALPISGCRDRENSVVGHRVSACAGWRVFVGDPEQPVHRAGIAGGSFGVCASLFAATTHGNAGNLGLIFDVLTGANTLVATRT
jgi:hypothetical protein